MIAEIIGGITANSIAILSDASHLLTDLSSFALSLIALRVTMWPKNKSYNFGYGRVELIIAFGNVAFIWVVTGGNTNYSSPHNTFPALLFEAGKRIQDLSSFEVQGKPMLIMACLAICFNLMYVL